MPKDYRTTTISYKGVSLDIIGRWVNTLEFDYKIGLDFGNNQRASGYRQVKKSGFLGDIAISSGGQRINSILSEDAINDITLMAEEKIREQISKEKYEKEWGKKQWG